MNGRKALFIIIIAICVFSLAYGIYMIIDSSNNVKNKTKIEDDSDIQNYDFDALFDNSIHYQNYTFGSEYKTDTSKELVYTVYKLNETKEGKYNINVELPFINLNNSKINDINTEMIITFGQKVQSIMANSNKEDSKNSIYTVEYTAYLNENILSLVIKSTLKEGNNAQRLIIQAYTYNLSSNELIPLKTMLEIKELDSQIVRNEITNVIQESVVKNANLVALGYNVYERDINSDIYKIENSNNYFLGPNGTIYIIYAYGKYFQIVSIGYLYQL